MIEAEPTVGGGGGRPRMVTNWLAELDGRRVTVEVPATSANLGAGYDCLGVALGLTNRVEVEVRGWSRGEIELTVDGEGVGELAADRTNRCVLGIEAALREVRGEIPDGVGWRIESATRSRSRAGSGRRPRRRWPGSSPGNSLLGEPLTSGGPAAARDRRSRVIPTTPRPRSSAGSRPAPITGDAVESVRFDAPRDLRAVLFIPDLRLRPTRCGRRCPPRSRSRTRSRT